MKAILTLVALLAIAAGSAQAAPQAKNTLVAAKSRYGTVLFDGKGRVLYGFTHDKRGKPSTCYGACARAWPVYFKASALRAGKGVKQKLIGTVKRKDGRLQVTYNGWPLYRFTGDSAAGDTNGQGQGGVWSVIDSTGNPIGNG